VRGAVYPVRSDNGLLTVREMSLGHEVVFGPFNRFVVALRGRSQLALMTELEDRGVDVRAIGDAAAPRNLLQATYEAHATARQL
jgi:hypothetical protein